VKDEITIGKIFQPKFSKQRLSGGTCLARYQYGGNVKALAQAKPRGREHRIFGKSCSNVSPGRAQPNLSPRQSRVAGLKRPPLDQRVKRDSTSGDHDLTGRTLGRQVPIGRLPLGNEGAILA
jgi:hypothetical protein